MQSVADHINDSRNKSKTAWRVINNELGKSKTSEIIKTIEADGEIHETKESVANSFCNYYTTLTEENNDTSLPTSTNEEAESEMECPEITKEEILKSIKYLKVNKPIGSDGIPAKFYNLFSDEITPVLHYIFNECMKQGRVPLRLKETHIKSLYKGKGKKTLHCNYRPISIISSTSKIYENIMYRRLSKYLEENNLINDSQHGYRKHRSTQSAVIHLTNNIRSDGDSKMYSGLVFGDFSKAFDMINHEILLKNLSSLGVKNKNLEWFRSKQIPFSPAVFKTKA
jgi:hypothetical protein